MCIARRKQWMKGLKESLEMVNNLSRVWLIFFLLGEKPEADRNPPVLYHNSRARSTGACNCGRKQAPRDDPFDIKAANYDFYQVTVRSFCFKHCFCFINKVCNLKWLQVSSQPYQLVNVAWGRYLWEQKLLARWPDQSGQFFTSACMQEHLFTLQVCWFMWILNPSCLWAVFPLLLWFSRSAELLNLNC